MGDAPYRPLHREVLRRPEPPPRHVPVSLRAELRAGRGLGILGWALMCFGSIFGWVFVARSEAVTALTFRGDKALTTGRIVRVEPTSMSENERTIMKVSFAYEDAAGRRREASSYATSAPVGEVDVEYLVDDPGEARILGLRGRPFAAWLGVVMILPAAGLVLAATAWRRGGKEIRLLRIGAVGEGKLRDRAMTNTRIEDQMVWEYVFEFEVDGQRYRVKARTHRDVLTDNEREPLLYDPRWPSNATMLDHLPGKPRIDDGGRIEATWGAASIAAFALPSLCLLINAVAWLIYAG